MICSLWPCDACNAKRGALLEIVDRLELDETDAELLGHEVSQEQAEWMARPQAEMFGVLRLLTSAEANQLVRSCEDKNGHVAWKKTSRLGSTRRRWRVSSQNGGLSLGLRRSITIVGTR